MIFTKAFGIPKLASRECNFLSIFGNTFNLFLVIFFAVFDAFSKAFSQSFLSNSIELSILRWFSISINKLDCIVNKSSIE